MKIPIRRKRLSLGSEGNVPTRSEASTKLRELINEDFKRIGKYDHNYDVSSAAFKIYSLIILISASLGTVILLLGAIHARSIPMPEIHATTQDGNIYQIKNYKVVRDSDEK